MFLGAQLVHMTKGEINPAKRSRHGIFEVNNSHAVQETATTTASLSKSSFSQQQNYVT